MRELNITEILSYIPHRYPFLMIDKILSYDPGKSIIGIKNVTFNEPYFTGHFPETPIMPGVLMIEALAQVSGILYYLTTGVKADADNWFFLAGADKARFKYVVQPGDQLRLESTLLRNKLNLWFYSARALVGDKLACSVELIIAKGALK